MCPISRVVCEKWGFFRIMCIQRHLIQPHVERLLLEIPIHLKCDINLFLIPLRLCRVIRIDHIVVVRPLTLM
jgi:hypothetical protein